MTAAEHPINGNSTVEEAKAWLRTRLEDGDHCPVCTQHAQVYRWSLYSTAVRALIGFYRLGGTVRFSHVNELKAMGLKGQGDASRLKHWGLAEEEKIRRPDGGRAGYWRVTDLGESFLQGRATIPKYVYVYDGKVLDTDGDPVTARQCLGNKFDLDILMHPEG